MINEWPVAFPVALSYSVWLAGVASDKENISWENLCCLFKVKVLCLHKVICLYTRTERHTSAGRERERKKEKHVKNQAALLSSNPHLSHRPPFHFSLLSPSLDSFSHPPTKQFSFLVMHSLIPYGQTSSSPSVFYSLCTSKKGDCHMQKCEQYDTRVKSKTYQLMNELAGVSHEILFHVSTHVTHHAHKHALLLIPAGCCGVLQDLSFLFPISTVRLRYSIKSGRDILENWPLFSQCLEGEGGGKDSEGTQRD